MQKLNVLMTGGGAPGAPGIIRSLTSDERINLLVGDLNENAVGRYLHPNFITLPSATAADFIEKLLEICLNNKIDVVFPLVTRELPKLSAVKDEWEKRGIKILVSDLQALEIANDKGMLYAMLKKEGIPYPDFVVANDITELKAGIFHLGYPEVKIVVKPCISNGMRGFRIVSPPVGEFEAFFKEKAGSALISFDKLMETLSGGDIPPMVVCEYLPGKEYTVDCLLDNGNPLLIVPRLRSKMTGGISVEGEIVNHPEIISYCKAILSKLKLHGNIGIQVKEARDGSIKLLEINPRIQGTTVALTGAGLNMALSAVWLCEDIKPEITAADIKWGTKFSRYWQEVYYT